MQQSEFRPCGCPACRQGIDHPDREQHRRINVLMGQLATEQRRLYAAIEAKRAGRGGPVLLSAITGMGLPTIRRGRAELEALLAGTPLEREGGRPGRRTTEAKYPGIQDVLERLLADETAGDPMTRKKWTRLSCRLLSRQLAAAGYTVSYRTVCRLLREMGYSLRVNVRARVPASHSPDRDRQFAYIAARRAAFVAAGHPVISVDAKKSELVGNFRADGESWSKNPIEVDIYRFPSKAECAATPYGVYDTATNKGYVWVGTSGNTPAFAVAALKGWWLHAGRHVYPDATDLLILADGGGSNGCRTKAWKLLLQREVCDPFGLVVTVCHYPVGCSKYNPIERRLFSHISMNWSGRPLQNLALMLGYIRGTRTETGLTVEAFEMEGSFPKGQKVSRKEMAGVLLEVHATCPPRNYTIRPQDGHSPVGEEKDTTPSRT